MPEKSRSLRASSRTLNSSKETRPSPSDGARKSSKKSSTGTAELSQNTLRIGWATHEAAKYACETWHYTGKIPVNKLVKIGAWEDEKFIGVVIFGMGASAVVHRQFSLDRFEVCELVRVALTNHVTPVSRIISIALKFLRKANPGLKVCVSFADPAQGHHGGIYQAGNWFYTGKSADTLEYFYNKEWRHVTDVYKRLTPDQVKMLKSRKKKGKYRYVMAFDEEQRAKIAALAKPYPKRDTLSLDSAPEASDAMRSTSGREKAVTDRPRRSKTKSQRRSDGAMK